MGLWQLHCQKIDSFFQNETIMFKLKLKDFYREVFQFMLMSIGLEDNDALLTKKQLRNPRSKVVCLILYLYSIEPPFYAELNSACRLLDESKLETLGPFARALFEILNCGLTESMRKDTLRKGE